MSVPNTPRRDERGFTLIETLVSLAMLTLALVALVQIFGVGFRGVRLSEMDAAALHLATSQLARAGTEAPLRTGEERGTASGGMEWSVVIEPYVLPHAEREPRRAGGLEAFWVTAEVRWQSSAFTPAQSLSLRTLKMTVAP